MVREGREQTEAFTAITHNDDFIVFDAYQCTEEVGFTESFKAMGFFIVSSISKGQFISFAVMFSGGEENKFLFPDAFDKGYLETIEYSTMEEFYAFSNHT